MIQNSNKIMLWISGFLKVAFKLSICPPISIDVCVILLSFINE